MPDQYLNLTPAEARALGYAVERVPPQREQPTTDADDNEGRAMGFVITVVLIGLFIGYLVRSVRQSATVAATQSVTAAQPQESGPPLSRGYPSGLSSTAPRSLPGDQSTQTHGTGVPQYLAAGWNYELASVPIPLYVERRRFNTVPAGTEFLRSFETSNGWSFVMTLDGRRWGWALLLQREPRRIPMQSKFEPALTRIRAVGAALPSQKDAYFPDGWTYEVINHPWTILHAGRFYTMRARTEYLRYWRPVNGWWFVITADGEQWGWTHLESPPELWPIRNGTKFAHVVEMMHGLCLWRPVPALGNAPGSAM